ncbi:putative Auxin response factor [Tripterygium wilfordii]|uniref:Auxin response factor n=1 Tax=Tripterygium wilfordii TaxID=458696 RepID=A0A7J7C3I6_TRIWF|nr:auxin response factor 3-like [Tripterygium wilfordii]KAF5728704.1 putative Auxin response factor [Tripterygium wilfordii]
MVGMIDLNTTEDEETPSSGSTSPSSSSASHLSASALGAIGLHCSGSVSGSVCLELWHACAGPLVSLPRKGSVVVYFPQGHLEQLSESRAVPCDLPPHIFCRVLDVKLHAEAPMDEVYAQVSLVPESEIERKLREGKVEAEDEEEDINTTMKSATPHMFCKTLTASDTSTHGGFSVPRRAAEDCFPPLDYTQQRPSQELVAKDLLGLEWKFRHIYRGQPRRHLLTTGWSAFVNKKKLASGDAVLFLRGDDGELRLGIRRATQIKCNAVIPALCCQQMNHSTFIDMVNAISRRSVFNICYNPRASSSDVILPLHKFLRSLDYSFSVGTRFKMRLETEDAAERRYTGLIAGIADVDPVKWPGSKWRCLLVRWDDGEANRLNRVSPWEIEPSGSVSSCTSLMMPSLKRSRTLLPSAKPESVAPDGIGASDVGEPSRFWKVLQGQEILGFNPLPNSVNFHNPHQSEIRRCFPGTRSSGTGAIGNGFGDTLVSSDILNRSVCFDESFQFRKVLQGQEILPSASYGRAPEVNETLEFGSIGISTGVQMPRWRNVRSAHMQGFDSHMCLSAPPTQVSSPSSVLMFQQASHPALNFNQPYGFNEQQDQRVGNPSVFYVSETCREKPISSSSSEPSFGRNHQGSMNHLGLSNERMQHGDSGPLVGQSAYRSNSDMVSSCKSSCRLFGFSLTEDRHDTNLHESENASTTPLTTVSSCVAGVRDRFHVKPLAMTKAAGSDCTNNVILQHRLEAYNIY